jgi:hypothetical protein
VTVGEVAGDDGHADLLVGTGRLGNPITQPTGRESTPPAPVTVTTRPGPDGSRATLLDGLTLSPLDTLFALGLDEIYVAGK